jgi:hypothetical protein
MMFGNHCRQPEARRDKPLCLIVLARSPGSFAWSGFESQLICRLYAASWLYWISVVSLPPTVAEAKQGTYQDRSITVLTFLRSVDYR